MDAIENVWSCARHCSVASRVLFEPGYLSAQESEVHWYSRPFDTIFPSAKTVFVYLYSDTCDPCTRVKTELFSDASIADFINNSFIPVKLDISTAEGKTFSRTYQLVYTPTFIFLGPDKKEIDRLSGLQGRGPFLSSLKQIVLARDTFGDYLAKLEKNPADTAILLKVFQKYADRSDIENMFKYKALIEKADEITYIINKENILGSLQRVLFAQRRYDEALQTTLSIIEQLPDADARIQYSFLASCYRYLQEDEKALTAHEKLVSLFPDDLTVYKNAVQFIMAADLDLDRALAIGSTGMTKKGASTDKAELAFNMAQIYQRVGQYPTALEMVDAAIALFGYAPYLEFREDIVDSMNGVSFRNLTASEVKAVLDDARVNGKPLVLLDVRSPLEFQQSHLPGAINIPADQLEHRIGELTLAEKSYVVVYCATGIRSRTASRILARAGYKRVINLVGGLASWEKIGQTR